MSVKDPLAMAGSKEAKKSSKKKDVPAKKSKSKPAPTKPSGLSEEKVVDSSSEEEAEEVKAAPPLPKGKDGSSSDSSEDTSSESEEEAETPAPVPKKANVAPAQVNGVKRKSAEAQSSSSSEEESSDEEEEEPQAKKAKTDATATDTPGKGKSASTGIESIPAPKFKPPPGYESLSSSEQNSFSQKSLAGKQIWHIIAPSKVPLDSVTEFALSSLKDQTPVLTHKSVDYILARDANPHGAQYDSIMLPSSDGYLFNSGKIEETLHLQQKIVLPNLKAKQADVNTGSQAAGDIAQAPVSDARPQPKGLKMRYKPPGFGKGKPGLGSESEEDEEEARRGSKKDATQFPKALGAHGASDKPDSGRTPSKEKSKQKHKKRKDPYDIDVEMDDADPMQPPPSAQPQRKQKKDGPSMNGEPLQRIETATSQQSAASGGSHEKEKTETPEERAKRKEAKRLRKEAKKKAKEAAS